MQTSRDNTRHSPPRPLLILIRNQARVYARVYVYMYNVKNCIIRIYNWTFNARVCRGPNPRAVPGIKIRYVQLRRLRILFPRVGGRHFFLPPVSALFLTRRVRRNRERK